MGAQSDNVVEFNLAVAGGGDAPIGLPGEGVPELVVPTDERTSKPPRSRGALRVFDEAWSAAVSRLRPAAAGEKPIEAKALEPVKGEAGDESTLDDGMRRNVAESEDQSATEAEGSVAPIVPAQPLWRRPALLGTASAVALSLAAGGAFLVAPASPRVQQQVAVVHETGMGDSLSPAEPMAPVARLAKENLGKPGEPAEVERPAPASKDALLNEIESLRGGGSARDGAKEPGAEGRSEQTSAGDAQTASAAHPAPKAIIAAPGPAREIAASKDAAAMPEGEKAERLAQPQGPQIGAPFRGKAATEGKAAEPMGDAPVVRVASVPTIPAPIVPAPTVAAPAAAERAAKAAEPEAVRAESEAKRAASAQESEPKRITPAQETQLLAMITEVSSLVRKTRAELAALTETETKSKASVEGKLEDFERRLNLSEARRALDEAKDVTVGPPASPQAQPAPTAPTPAGKAKGGVQKGVATASAQADGGAVSAAQPRYRVQAASPGLAMLAEVDRSGEEITPLQVTVGGEVPGYGRVTKISQRGSEWVVQTEKGPIQ